jgi:hypothetical protein
VQVAVLMFANLELALATRKIDDADSYPYWLQEHQYQQLEHGKGYIFLPSTAPVLMRLANEKGIRPLGLVAINEKDDDYACFVSNEGIKEKDRAFALDVFSGHAYVWFCLLPGQK